MTCAKGPASRSAPGAGRTLSSTRAPRRSSPRSIDITSISESSVAIRSSMTVAMRSRWAATAAFCRSFRRDASGSPRRCRAASSSGRSDVVQAWASTRCRARTSSMLSQGAHLRRYAGTDHRSPTMSAGSRRGHARARAALSSRFCSSDLRSRSGGASTSSSFSMRIVTSSSQIWSRASLCAVPGSGASNASAQSWALSGTSDQGVSTVSPLAGGSSYSLTAGSMAATSSADAFRRATRGSASTVAAAPWGTRSRRTQIWTPSSPRLGSTSET